MTDPAFTGRGDRNGPPLLNNRCRFPFNVDDRNNNNRGDDPAFTIRGDRKAATVWVDNYGHPVFIANDKEKQNNNRVMGGHYGMGDH